MWLLFYKFSWKIIENLCTDCALSLHKHPVETQSFGLVWLSCWPNSIVWEPAFRHSNLVIVRPSMGYVKSHWGHSTISMVTCSLYWVLGTPPPPPPPFQVTPPNFTLPACFQSEIRELISNIHCFYNQQVTWLSFSQQLMQLLPRPLWKHSLKFVLDWHSLSVNLDLSGPGLGTIERNYRGDNTHCKTEMLSRWLENTARPSWKAVCQALHLMEADTSCWQRKYVTSTATQEGMFILLGCMHAYVCCLEVCLPSCRLDCYQTIGPISDPKDLSDGDQ